MPSELNGAQLWYRKNPRIPAWPRISMTGNTNPQDENSLMRYWSAKLLRRHLEVRNRHPSSRAKLQSQQRMLARLRSRCPPPQVGRLRPPTLGLNLLQTLELRAYAN